MNSILCKPSEFSSLLQRFFTDRLLQQRNASPRTIAAYRDAFRLFFKYAEKQHKKSASQFTLNDFTATVVLEFLAYLEADRRNTIRSRNSRLTAFRSFARFIALQCPPAINNAQQVLAIPTKKFEKPMLGFLSREEVRALLIAPEASSWSGQRDRVMFTVLYNTGARVSELLDLHVADVRLAGGCSSVLLHGKGRKQRTVPLWKETATLIRQWIQKQSLTPDRVLLPNRRGARMTRSNVAERLALAVVAATPACPTLKGRQITPHTFRHSTAMHMLQSGVDITVIALWLGHESPVTTHGYLEADLEMKRRAIDAVNPPRSGRNRYKPSDSLLGFLESL
jgi:site-specific recombinase XerD